MAQNEKIVSGLKSLTFCLTTSGGKPFCAFVASDSCGDGPSGGGQLTGSCPGARAVNDEQIDMHVA